MNAMEIREVISDPNVRGQYLAAIRHRGKDVLLKDIEEMVDLLVGYLVDVDSAECKEIELSRQVSALQTSQDNIINGLGIKGDGPYSKLVLEKFILLAGEVDAYRALVDNLGVIHSLKAPETDNLLAYYKAQGVDEFLNDEFVQEVAMRLADFNGETEETVNTVVWSGMPPEPEGNVWELEYVSRASFLARKLKDFAANLRAGRKG